MSDLALETVDLKKTFEHGRVRALDGISLQVAGGETVAIVGPSGSGKTTFLNMAGALDVPSSGEACVFGQPVSRSTDLDRLRAREIGFIFQLHNLIPTLTAGENVEIPMMALGIRPKERQHRAAELLKRVGLADRCDFPAPKLSGGERQRVAVARALANRPRIVLGDEPTGSLDSTTSGEVMDLLLDLHREGGLTLILVTHDPEVAKRMERTVELRDGRIASDVRCP